MSKILMRFCQAKYCTYMLRWKHNERAKVRDIEVTNDDPIYSPNLASNYFHIVSRTKTVANWRLSQNLMNVSYKVTLLGSSFGVQVSDEVSYCG